MAELLPELELPVGVHHYRIARMNTFDQMTVASEFRDILIGLTMIRAERPEDMTDAEYNEAVRFMIMSRGNVSEERRHRIVNLCLSNIQRRAGQGYLAVMAGPNQLQFSDIELPDIAQLMYATFEHNKLLDFFGASPSASGLPKTTDNGQSLETGKTG